ncbi:MAG TPA: 30S ribosomal protein S9 [Nitrososphaerales archaeon]|nr:30S ribosomal protein S9 [Nitrososphaerales archaeon]
MVTKKTKLYSGSRKQARATAAIMQGTGKVKINNVPAEIFSPTVARQRILTPLILAGELRDKVDIDVRVAGGGFMGQAEAAAMAISRALADWTRGQEIRRRIAEYDVHLLSGDARQPETKKFGGPGPRRRKQKSYR